MEMETSSTAKMQSNSSATTNSKEVVNHVRLNYLIMTVSTGHVRHLFSKKWSEMGNPPWNNQNGESTLRKIIGDKTYKSEFDARQKKSLENDKLEVFDLPLLCNLLQHLDPSLTYNLKELKKIRNHISHTGAQTLSDSQFQTNWNRTIECLKGLGMSEDELDSQLYSEENLMNPKPNFKYPEWANYQRAVETGNVLLEEMKYEEAKKLFSDVISKGSVANDNLANAYFLRSKCNFYLDLLDEAEVDGTSSITLNPFSSDCYRWLGFIHEEKGERLGNLELFEKSVKNYESALLFCKNNDQKKEIERVKMNCKFKVEKLKRREYLEPLLTDERKKQYELDPIMQKMYPEFEKMMEKVSSEETIWCIEAAKHLDGLHGYTQNYEKAAELYAAAARKGSANGLYNLGYLLSEGKGVQRNVPEAIEMYKKAAGMKDMEFCPITGKDIRNNGVAQSQFALGLAAQTGLVQSPDTKEAIKWYQRALFNGYFPAGINLGQLYESGDGVEKNMELAALCLSVGALNGSVRAAESLVGLYTNPNSNPNPILAYSWLCYALELKSLSFSEHFINIIERRVSPNQKKSFDLKTFLSQVRSNVEASPFKNALPKEHPKTKNARVERFPSVPIIPLRTSTGTDPSISKRIWHRECLSKLRGKQVKIKGETKVPPNSNMDLINLKPITFREMIQHVKQNEDTRHDGKVIKLTVIEDAVVTSTSATLIVRDEEGSVETMTVYGYPEQGKKLQDAIGFGSSLQVVHPLFGLAKDGQTLRIRVDEPNTIIEQKGLKDKQMCRYCLKGGGKIVCRHCERAYYCDKLCMKKDKDEMCHKVVCLKRL